MDSDNAPQSPQPASWSWRRPAGISWVRWAELALVVVVGVGVVLLLPALGRQEPMFAANVRDILAQPGAYRDKQVVVSGRIDEVLTHRAVTLRNDLSAGSLLALVEETALVNGYGDLSGPLPQEQGPLYQAGDFVQFLGTVERFHRAALAEEFNLVLNEELFGAMESEPVLLVERLDVAALAPDMAMPTVAPLDGGSAGAQATPAPESSD